MQGFRRHDLVWLDPDTDMALVQAEAEHVDAVAHWLKKNWPLVVTRQSDAAVLQTGHLQLGLSLPSAPARTRVSLRVPQAAIISYSRPLLLKDAIPYAPKAWVEHLSGVVEICAAHEVVVSVYGSLSTQAFTGKNYLDESSDVDVLFECSKEEQVRNLFAELNNLAQQKPHLDGEMFAPNGWAVAWREVAAALHSGKETKLLAKSFNETRLLVLDQLFAQQ